MFCSKCGNTVADDASFCSVCGQAVASAGVAVAAPSGMPAVNVAQQTSGKAIASLILGLLSFTFLTAIPAIVLGHIALSEIKKSADRIKGKGMAIAGLVLGYLGIAMMPMILIIAAIAIPNLLRARIAANEASVVSSVRLLNATEVSYAGAHPGEGFSSDLRTLVSYGQLNPTLGTGRKNGYVFRLSDCGAEKPGGPKTKFQVAAYPIGKNETGVRAFCSDESGVIKYDPSGSPEDCVDHGSALGASSN